MNDKKNLMRQMALSTMAVSLMSLMPMSPLHASEIAHNVEQQRTIMGKVIDGNGDEVIGATIKVVGTKAQAISDLTGNFTISVPANATLEINYIGYKTEKVNVGNQTKLTITITEDDRVLDEVVVVGYGTSRKKDLTGSVSSVRAKDLNTVSSSSVSQMLQGKVSGMSAMQGSAQPGASVSINIRGAVSPNGSNSPLYVIDGVPIQTNTTADPGIFGGFQNRTGVSRDPLNTLNPNDIESIDVLKDASAAAIYGASAANGVVIITTKSGKAGKVKVDYRSTLTAQIRKSYPEVLDAKSFREQANFWTKEYYLFNNGMGAYGDIPEELGGYTPVFSDVNSYTADTKWIDEVSRQGYIIDQDVSVNGGSEKTKYFFSYNYYGNQGMLKQSDMKRHTVRLNIDQEFSKRVKGGVKFTYSNLSASSTSTGSAGKDDNMLLNVFRFAPDVPVYDEEGKYSRSYNKLFNNPASFSNTEDKTTTDRIFVAPTIEVKLIKGLTLKGVGGFDQTITQRNFYVPVKAMHTSEIDGYVSMGQSKVQNISGEVFLNYDKVLGEVHHLSGVLGVGYYKTVGNGFGLAGAGFFTDAFGYNNVGIASNKNKEAIGSWRTERTKLSQFIRLNYSLMDKYLVSATARRDGSSYFAENNKWGIFPSVSVAWRISEESFLKDKTPLSDLKLRIGYGAVGNENVLGTNSMSLYKSGYNYLIGSSMQTGLALTQVANPNLKWETDYTTNIGLDFGLFNQRLTGSIEYFHRGAKDLLDYQQLPANNAVGRMAANIGETQSKGFELSLVSHNIDDKKVKWDTNFNLSYFKANWVKRNPEVALADYIGEKDNIDQIYGWKTDGIIRSKEDIPSYMPDAKVGNIKYVDVNEDGVLDSKDVVKLGNSTPRWYAGLGNTLSWNGFDLNFYFYGAFGMKKTRGQLPDVDIIGNQGNAPSNTYVSIYDVYSVQTGKGWMPGIATNVYNNSNPTGTHDFYLMNASYVKLKSVTLGYALPQSIFVKSNFIKSCRFFLDAQNVFTITSYKGFDPELASDLPYPQAVSLSFGFNIGF